jgi:hypothetical protein
LHWMPAPVALPHPRKLYSILQACPSADARAKAVLEFMRLASGARAGYLLLWRDERLVVVAGSPTAEPPAGLLDAAQRAWSERPLALRSDTTTVDLRGHLKGLAEEPVESPWESGGGASFAHRVLTIHRDSRWLPLGIAMLELEAAQRLAPLRRAHVESMGDALFDAGDVQGAEPLPQLA